MTWDLNRIIFTIWCILFCCSADESPANNNEDFVEPNSECAHEMTCCFLNEVVKCYKSPCANNTCETAYMPTYFCRAMSIRLTHCDCKDGYFRNDAGECVTKKQCLVKPKLASNPECSETHMALVGCLHPQDYRKCPSKSSTGSSSDSSFCSSSSSSSSSSLRSSSAKESPFDSFIKSHASSDRCLLNVCICQPPYYLNRCGECVTRNRCKKSCSKLRCVGPNERRHRGKCICRDKFYRNKCGQCVSKEQLKQTAECFCTNPCPGANTIRRKFNNKTQRTCQNYLEPIQENPTRYRVACDCAEGFYSNSTGFCVQPSECN